MSDDLDMALRFKWMHNRKIKADDTLFKFGDGAAEKKIKFKFPCTQLEFDGRKYRCKAYGKERPSFCTTYPDHIFYRVESWNTEKIEMLLKECSKDCPGLKGVTVKDVVKMLEER